MAAAHPSHDPTVPIDLQYSYSINGFVGGGSPKTTGSYNDTGIKGNGAIWAESEITRSKSDVIFAGEENMWSRPGNTSVLNDNALCADGRDWLGTFHGAKSSNWNGGTVNCVFVDSHVGSVKSGLQVTPGNTQQADLSQAEFLKWEKFSYPKKTRP
jgi:prepilin-type processing-associated H-X9-DG protein